MSAFFGLATIHQTQTLLICFSFTHSQMGDDVRFRKLQPIYNAVDARNYKAAIKLCSKKDLEKWDIVKTLKAHALERTGKIDEALDLCRDVKARNPTDAAVLNTLVLTFKVSVE